MVTRHDHRYDHRLPRPSHVLLRHPVLLTVAVAAALTLTVLAAVAHEWLLNVDRPLAAALRDPELTAVLRGVTEAGSPNAAAILSVVAALSLWPRCRAFAIALPLTVAGGVLVDVTLKALIDRPRPPMAQIGTSLASYPSGHVIQATIVFGLLVPALFLLTGRQWVSRVALASFVTMSLGVAWSRIGLGAHWPTDTLGSFFVGASLLLAAEFFVGSGWAVQRCGRCRIHQLEQDRAAAAEGHRSVDASPSPRQP